MGPVVKTHVPKQGEIERAWWIVDAEGLRLGVGSFSNAPLESPEMPSWDRVSSILPQFPAMLKEAVERDNQHEQTDEYRAA